MAKLDLNLSARPFVNEAPLVRAVILLAAVLALATFANFYTFFAALVESRALSARLASDKAQAEMARAEAKELAGRLTDKEKKRRKTEAIAANAIVRKRKLSWTRLFEQLELVLPRDVRIEQILPDVQGSDMLLVMECVAHDDVAKRKLFDKLYEAPFSEAYIMSAVAEDGGKVRFSVRCRYDPQGPEASPIYEPMPWEIQAAASPVPAPGMTPAPAVLLGAIPARVPVAAPPAASPPAALPPVGIAASSPAPSGRTEARPAPVRPTPPPRVAEQPARGEAAHDTPESESGEEESDTQEEGQPVTEVLRRFFEERRTLLMVLLGVTIGNVLFYVILSGPAQLRSHVLVKDVTAAEEDLRTALRDYGHALLESELMESASRRVDVLRKEIFQTSRERWGPVDQKLKEIQDKFRLEPHAVGYDYSPLVAERLEQMSISFNLKGSYDNLRRFLGELEQARDEDGKDLFFVVDGISLADSTETGSDLNLTITVSTYFYKPELAEAERVERVSGRPRGSSVVRPSKRR